MTPRAGVAVAVAMAVVLSACAFRLSAAQRADMPVTAQLAERVEAWRARGDVPAISVAVRGDVDWSYASGTRPDTQFRMASITKLFVAAVVMQLVEEGRLDLDAPAVQAAPGLGLSADVTLRQLLNHTSGLPDYGTEAFVDGLKRNRERRWHADELLRLVEADGQEFTPGSAWQYSNSNYVALGEIIAAVTGRPWHVALRERVLDPLGLSSTYVAGLEPARGGGVIDEAYFDLDNDGDQEDIEQGPWPALESSEGAAGALISTAADVATFTSALFDGQLLQPSTLAQMVTGTPFGRRYDNYGLGVELQRPDLQTPTWGHGGFLPGYRSVTWFLPESDSTITVALNDSRSSPADLAELLRQIID